MVEIVVILNNFNYIYYKFQNTYWHSGSLCLQKYCIQLSWFLYNIYFKAIKTQNIEDKEGHKEHQKGIFKNSVRFAGQQHVNHIAASTN